MGRGLFSLGRKDNRAQPIASASYYGGGAVSPHFKDYQSYLKAYRLPWVKACVSVIAYSVSNVLFDLVDPAKEDDARVVPTSPVLDLLAHPNPFQTRFQLFESLVTDLELTGNGFMSLEAMDGGGRPSELYRLRPDNVIVEPDPHNRVGGYTYTVNGRHVSYKPEEVVHFQYPNPLDDLYGMGVIEAGEARFDSEMAMLEHERQFWRNGAKITGILQTDNQVDDTIFQRLKENIRQFFQGSGYSTLMLEAGLKYQSVSDGPAKLGMLDMAIASRDMILAMFGVPPTKVGIIESANYKASAADEFFWDETIDPKLTRMEQDLSALVEIFHPGKGYVIEFNRRNFSDDQDMATIAKTMMDTRVFTINEIRAYQNKPPLEKDGDVILGNAGEEPVDLSGSLATANEMRAQTGLPPLPGGDALIILRGKASSFQLGAAGLAPTASGAGAPAVPSAPSAPAKAARNMNLKLIHTSPNHPATGGLVRRDHTQALASGVRKYAPKLTTFFAAQEKRVKTKLAGFKRNKKALGDDDGALFDSDSEDDELGDVLQPLYQDAMGKGYATANRVGVDVTFDLEQPGLKALAGKLAKRVTEVNQSTKAALDDQINEGMRRGYSVVQIADGVPDENYPGVTGVFDDAKGYRAEMIARTETAAAYSSASIQAYKDSDAVDEVEVMDGTEDSECEEANGETWTLDEADAEPTAHPNCSRAFLPIVKSKSAVEIKALRAELRKATALVDAAVTA